MIDKAGLGCWADGSFGHSHVRAKLADMMDTFGQRTLCAWLEDEMSDDASEERDAIDWLNEHACTEGVWFEMVDGDLMLVDSDSECES